MSARIIGRIVLGIFICTALALPGVGAAGIGARAGRNIPRGGDPGSLLKCSPRLQRLLASSDSGDTVAVWIFLSDRGGAEKVGRDPCLSPRSASRRLLRGGAETDEHDLPVNRGYIDSLRSRVVRLRHVSRYFNAVSADVDSRWIGALCACDFVRSLDRIASGGSPAPPIDYQTDPYSSAQGSEDYQIDYGASYDQLNQIGTIELLEEGYNGSGAVSGQSPVLIAILDTGFKIEHEALADVQIEAQWDFVQGDSVVSNQDGDASDQDYHGTTVLGIIAGHAEGSLIGPAWGARYLLAKTEIVTVEEPIEEDHWIAGIEWADSAGADIVTSSLGYSNWYTNEELNGDSALCTVAADIAVSHGIVVVNSAGNRGAAGLVAPADGDSVLAIGAVDASGTIAYFSSRGPTADGRIKPDFTARGVKALSVSYSDLSAYGLYSGTSYAAPITAGMCALLLEAHPEWNAIELRDALRATSSKSASPDNTYGWGIPNAALASEYEGSFTQTAGAFPNPFNRETNVMLSLASLAPMTVRVYDCRGIAIRTLAKGRPAQQSFTLTWDGRNDRGERSASGVYFLRIESPGLSKTVKVILLR
ncbi:MAG: S8 family serine peptidase [Candidatus Krumholzibacteria bacterium]|nr:S8 family serine peptidase [Candidatus Krumholzibacteria bacterium]